MPKIIPVVEGYGEEKAVPCLIRLWLEHRHIQRYFEVPNLAINAKGCGKLKAAYNRERHLGIEHYIQAALRNHPDAILVILDSDGECRNRERGNIGLGPELLLRAIVVAPHVPLAVVIANCEYEAWFLSNFRSFRDRGFFQSHIRFENESDPESHANCKGVIAEYIGEKYEETIHQLELTKHLRFSPASIRRSPSYGKLIRDLDRLTRESRK